MDKGCVDTVLDFVTQPKMTPTIQNVAVDVLNHKQ